jgi:hypothetical protein
MRRGDFFGARPKKQDSPGLLDGKIVNNFLNYLGTLPPYLTHPPW